MIDWKLPDPYYLYEKLELGHIPETAEQLLEVETIIAKDGLYSYLYAVNILKGRFLLGEPSIAAQEWVALLYAQEVIHGRFEDGEILILSSKDPKLKRNYIDFLRGDTVNID